MFMVRSFKIMVYLTIASVSKALLHCPGENWPWRWTWVLQRSLHGTHPQDRRDVQAKIFVSFYPLWNHPKTVGKGHKSLTNLKYFSDTLKILWIIWECLHSCSPKAPRLDGSGIFVGEGKINKCLRWFACMIKSTKGFGHWDSIQERVHRFLLCFPFLLYAVFPFQLSVLRMESHSV